MYGHTYDAGGHTFGTFVASTRGPMNLEAHRLLYFIARATTRQHMHYYTTDLKYETVMARNIQRVNAVPVASAAMGLGIAVGARGLAGGNIGQNPPQRGWRMQDEITAAMGGQIVCKCGERYQRLMHEHIVKHTGIVKQWSSCCLFVCFQQCVSRSRARDFHGLHLVPIKYEPMPHFLQSLQYFPSIHLPR